MSLKTLQDLIHALSKERTVENLHQLIVQVKSVKSAEDIGGLPMGSIAGLVREMTYLAERNRHLLNGNFLEFFFGTFDFATYGIRTSGEFRSGRKEYPRGYDQAKVEKQQAHFCENAGKAAKNISLEYKHYVDANDPEMIKAYLGWIPVWERYSRAAAYLFLKAGSMREAAFNYTHAGDACVEWHQSGQAGYREMGRAHYQTALRLLASEDRREGVVIIINRATEGLSLLNRRL